MSELHDDELDAMLGALGPPAGGQPNTSADAILAMAVPVVVAAPVARAGFSRWVLGASVVGSLAAGFFGGVVATMAMADRNYGSPADPGTTARIDTPEIPASESRDAVFPEYGPVADATAERSQAIGVSSPTPDRSESAVASAPGEPLRDRRRFGSSPSGGMSSFASTGGGSGPVAPFDMLFPSDPDPLPTFEQRTSPPLPNPPPEDGGRGRARASERPGRSEVADARYTRAPAGDTPWSLVLGGGWASGAAPGPEPRGSGGPLANAAVRLATTWPSRVHVAGEAGVRVDTMLVPVVTGAVLAPNAAVELGFAATDKVTPSVGWGVSGRVPLGNRPERQGPEDPPVAFLTGPRVNLDLGDRDKAHFRMTFAVEQSPDRLATEGLRPLAALTGAVEIPLARRRS